MPIVENMKLPDGTIQRAVCTAETSLWDFGTSINGIIWETVSEIPNPANTIVYAVENGVYFAENGTVNASPAIVVNTTTQEIKFVQ